MRIQVSTDNAVWVRSRSTMADISVHTYQRLWVQFPIRAKRSWPVYIGIPPYADRLIGGSRLIPNQYDRLIEGSRLTHLRLWLPFPSRAKRSWPPYIGIPSYIGIPPYWGKPPYFISIRPPYRGKPPYSLGVVSAIPQSRQAILTALYRDTAIGIPPYMGIPHYWGTPTVAWLRFPSSIGFGRC